MGQRVNPRHRQGKVRVELVGDAQSMGLQTEPQQFAVAAVGRAWIGDSEGAEILRSQPNPVKPPRCLPYQAEIPEIRAIDASGFHPHRFAEQRAR